MRSNPLSRRQALRVGGGLLAAAALPRIVRAADAVEIRMLGTADGSAVWFDPAGLHVEPGTTIRWVVEDQGNSHTSTAYHPDNDGHPLRIPEAAEPWNSDYLLPGERFERRLTVEGVYDYYCIPHEQAGMVGRIIVGAPSGPAALSDADYAAFSAGRGWQPLPEVAAARFPKIADILARGTIPGEPHAM